MRRCTLCDEEKPETREFFYPHKLCRGGLNTQCRVCVKARNDAWKVANRERARAYSRKWREQNPEAAIERTRSWCRKARLDVLAAYGGQDPACACCGETTEQFLVIDHIDGGGCQERKERGAGSQFYAWLRRNDYPEGYQVLCHNCNAAKSLYGECPHVSARIEVAA